MCSDNLPTISNGDINYTGGSANSRPVGATAIYTCTSSYTLSGVATRTCESTGQWSVAATPMCLLSKWMWRLFSCWVCTSLQVSALTCPHWKMESSPTTLSHLITDQWTQWPRTPVTMATLSVERNKEYVYPGGSGVGQFRPVLVSISYTIVTLNLFISFCAADSGPTDPPPPITCPHLPPLDNGMINYNNEDSPKPVNTGAIYMCSTGYTLSVPTTRTCGSNGQWSGSAPVCQCKWM